METLGAYHIDVSGSRKSGSALIININEFENGEEMKRNGSAVDVENMRSLLEDLNFEVVVERNLKKNDIIRKIMKFTEKMEGKGNEKDICAVCVMSHGNSENQFMAHDNEYLNIEDDVLGRFSNQNCRAMIGKPKLFFFQCCRGGKKDHRIVTQGKSMVSDGPRSESSYLNDALVAWASPPGFVALRDVKKGSPFIETVCEVFKAHAQSEEVKDMCLLVTNKMDEMEHKLKNKQTKREDDVKNVPVFEMRGLKKKLFLKPKSSQLTSPTPTPSTGNSLIEPDKNQKKSKNKERPGRKRKNVTRKDGEHQPKKRKK